MDCWSSADGNEDEPGDGVRGGGMERREQAQSKVQGKVQGRLSPSDVQGKKKTSQRKGPRNRPKWEDGCFSPSWRSVANDGRLEGGGRSSDTSGSVGMCLFVKQELA